MEEIVSAAETKSDPMPSKLDSEKKEDVQQILKTILKDTSTPFRPGSENAGPTLIPSDKISVEPCIHRVPRQLRDVKPQAYTPRMVVIGPLHLQQPPPPDVVSGASNSNPWYWYVKEEYRKMEAIKKTYMENFTQRVGEDTIELMRGIIEADETNIRGSYNESTKWIKSLFFVDLILRDSVFIMEFIIGYYEKGGNHIMSNIQDKIPFDIGIVKNDLVLLENQLPFFILRSLFTRIVQALHDSQNTLEKLILPFFGLYSRNSIGNFKHLTDMFRCVYEASLEPNVREQMGMDPEGWPAIKELRNANNLSQAGVYFDKSLDKMFIPKFHLGHGGGTQNEQPEPVEERYRNRYLVTSLHVDFRKGTLTMPEFLAEEISDIHLRNVIAYEQCNIHIKPYTSNYILFLNFLITSTTDVKLLIQEEVITNTLGRPRLVLDMVNNLQVGVRQGNVSQYYDIANRLDHYKSRTKRDWATLKNVYFKDLWTGTATIGGVFLLLMTLASTIATVMQTYKAFHK